MAPNPVCCARCQTILRRIPSLSFRGRDQFHRSSSSSTSSSTSNSAPSSVDYQAALARPAWSVRSLLPPTTDSSPSSTSPNITPTQLRHLLRLSALPPPKDLAEESAMLKTLESQLHFVRDVQSVDTEGVEPLRAIRDETPDAARQEEIGLEELKHVFEAEEVVGPTRRIRNRNMNRVKHKVEEANKKGEEEDWDVLGQASRKVGKYFVVETAEGGKE